MGRPARSDAEKGTRPLVRQLQRFQKQLLYYEEQVHFAKQRIETLVTAIQDLNAIAAPPNGFSSSSVSTTVSHSYGETDIRPEGGDRAL